MIDSFNVLYMENKNVWWWIGGAALVVVIAAVAVSMRWAINKDEPAANETAQSSVQLPENPATETNNETAESSATPAVAGNKTPAAKPAPSPDTSYQAALSTYEYRIQFVNCRGTALPGVGTLSVKKNVKFMLDNRDNKTHTFAFAGQTHTAGPYDFVIASISKPGTYNLTCDGGGAAKINIED